jgi:hypothetical protein
MNEYRNFKLAGDSMGSRLRNEDWKRQVNWSCNRYMGTTQGNSLGSYLYQKLTKHHVSHFILLVFLLQNWRTVGWWFGNSWRG